jgi:hypothetical protein
VHGLGVIIEICCYLELFLTLYFGEIFCFVRGTCETVIRVPGVYLLEVYLR